MVDFGGFDMPLFYSSITHEHQQVRQKAGIFDVSHMGELIITGNDALRFTNYILTNTITENTLKVTYALLCDHDGMIMDDLLVYVMDVSHVLLVVNASNTQKDFEWILSQKMTLTSTSKMFQKHTVKLQYKDLMQHNFVHLYLL